MPELPDVEGFRRELASCVDGRRIERVEVADAGVLRSVTPRRLRQTLGGRRLAEPERRGKWLLAPTDGPAVLLLHFGMTGRLVCTRPGEPLAPHDRVALVLDDGRALRFRDQRKLQGVWLARSAPEAEEILSGQGPDATSVSRGELDRLLSGRRGRVKSVLVDQAALAGLGNLLADEILWRARVHPARKADRLTAAERHRIHAALGRVMSGALPAGHVPAGPSWLTGQRDAPEPACPRCRGPLRRTRLTGRTTVWCPRCQPEGE